MGIVLFGEQYTTIQFLVFWKHYYTQANLLHYAKYLDPTAFKRRHGHMETHLIHLDIEHFQHVMNLNLYHLSLK